MLGVRLLTLLIDPNESLVQPLLPLSDPFLALVDPFPASSNPRLLSLDGCLILLTLPLWDLSKQRHRKGKWGSLCHFDGNENSLNLKQRTKEHWTTATFA